MREKWLITGGAGQLAQEVSNYLINEKIELLIPSKYQLNICNENELNKFITDQNPNFIVNCASYNHVDKAEHEVDLAYKVNAFGVQNLATVAKITGAKLVHISTDYVFDGQKNTPYVENDIVNPLSVYGKSKRRGEEILLELYPENSLIVRSSWLYGVYGRNIYKWIIDASRTDTQINLIDDQIGQPTWTKNLTNIIVELARNSDATGIFHATNQGSTSWYGFGKKITQLLNLSDSFIQKCTQSDLGLMANRPKYSAMQSQRLAEFGIQPLPYWDNALSELLHKRSQAANGI